MKYLVCSIRDIVHHEFNGLNLELSEASAIRNFQSALASSSMKSEGLLFSHPGDFELWIVGEFDSESGSLGVFDSNVFLMRGDDYDA